MNDRIEASICVLEEPKGIEGSILLLKRYPQDKTWNGWCLPGGRLEPGETPEQALVREVKEETGYDIVVGRKLFETEDFKANGPFLIHVFVARAVGGELLEFPTEEHAGMAIVSSMPGFPDLGFVAKRAIQEYMRRDR